MDPGCLFFSSVASQMPGAFITSPDQAISSKTMKERIAEQPRVHMLLLTKHFDPNVLLAVLDHILQLLEPQPGHFQHYYNDQQNI